jgi:predicted Ser/Thr protein kinase
MGGVSPLASRRHTRFDFDMATPTRSCTICGNPVPRGDMFCPTCGADAPTEIQLDDGAEPDVAASDGAWADLRAELQAALGTAFEVRRLLGRGGFGEVWEAYDVRLSRSVAVKVLRPELATSSAYRRRFHREARSVARMRHSGIVPIYHIGETSSLMYFIMPLVEGITLKTALDREGRLGPEEATRILAEAAEALREAHRRGIVHRDLKPENVMLEGPERRVLLMDFGIAQTEDVDREITGGGLVLGSPEYMSPEQAIGGRLLDGRSDIYSLGVMGYRMLAGRLPFVAPTVREILTQHVLTPPERLADCAPVPPHLSDVVMRCLAKHPEERWQSVDELLAALVGDPPAPEEDAVAASPPAGLAPTAVPAAPAPPARRRDWKVELVLSLAVVALAVAGWFAARWSDARRQAAADAAAATSYEAAATDVVSTYGTAAESLRAMAVQFRRGALTGSQYRAAAASLRQTVEQGIAARYGAVLGDVAAWPSASREQVTTTRQATWGAVLPNAALQIQESGTVGCSLQRRDSVVVLRDGASGTNCWWSTAPDPSASPYGAPVEYQLRFDVTGARPTDGGLGLAWCGKANRCRVLWLWLEGRVEWATHATGGGLGVLQLGQTLRVASGEHQLRVRFESGGMKVWMDGRAVLVRAGGETDGSLRDPGDLRVVVQNTALAMDGPEALTVVGAPR